MPRKSGQTITGGGSSSPLLCPATIYAPTVDPALPIGQVSFAAVDTTNLVTHPFIVPASANYKVTVRSYDSASVAGSFLRIGFVDHGGIIQRGNTYMHCQIGVSNDGDAAYTEVMVIGDTVGAGRMLDLYAIAGGSDFVMHADNALGAVGTAGPIVIQVYEL